MGTRMSAVLHLADENERLRRENVRLRQDIEAQRIALADKTQANAALRLELTTVRDYCAERIEAAAEQIARIRQAITEVVK